MKQVEEMVSKLAPIKTPSERPVQHRLQPAICQSVQGTGSVTAIQAQVQGTGSVTAIQAQLASAEGTGYRAQPAISQSVTAIQAQLESAERRATTAEHALVTAYKRVAAAESRAVKAESRRAVKDAAVANAELDERGERATAWPTEASVMAATELGVTTDEQTTTMDPLDRYYANYGSGNVGVTMLVSRLNNQAGYEA